MAHSAHLAEAPGGDHDFVSEIPPVMACEQRRSLVAAAAGELEAGHWILYRHAYRQLPVGRVPHEALLYRAANGRLSAEVRERFNGDAAAVADFIAREDTPEVQRDLHALLLTKAADPSGPLFQELQRVAQQVEPLLVTAEGVVVNGNRRLAAMRELLQCDPQRYAGFASITVACLPRDAGQHDIEFVEASLQMVPETKLVYGWLNRRIKLRHQLEVLGLPAAQLVEGYRLDSEDQLHAELAELGLAERYLGDFLGQPYAYSSIGDAEPLFAAMRVRLDSLEEPLREIWQMLGFVMIHGAPSRKNLDRLFPFADPAPAHLPSWAIRRLAARWGIAGAGEADERSPPSASERADLMARLADPGKSADNAGEIVDLLDSLRVEHAEGRAPERLLQRMKQTGQLIAKLEPHSLTDKHRRQLRVHLAELQAQASYLLGEMEQRPQPRAPAKPRRSAPAALGKARRVLLRRLGLGSSV